MYKKSWLTLLTPWFCVEFLQVQYMDLCEMGCVYNIRYGQVHFES